MSYNGSGVFQINSSGQPVVTGTVISSTAFNALTADLATGLSTAITKDGQTTTTARILFAQGVSSTLVTDATSATTGSIITAGGISMQKALWVGTTSRHVGAATFDAAITYGGVTLSNAVTGTGNMVLSTSASMIEPTATGNNSNNCLRLARNTTFVGGAYIYANSGDMFGVNDGTLYPFTVAQGAASNTLVVGTASVTVGKALTYGGVTLSNSVTGTGSMVLSASPTFTGTLTTTTGFAATTNGTTNYNGNQISTAAAFFYVIPGTAGVYIAANGTSWIANSLRSLKCDFEPITDPISRINGLRAELGRYKEDAPDAPLRPFLFVEDARAVFPWAVASNDEGMSYTDIVPLLVAGQQAIYAENEALKARVAALEERLN